MWLHGIDGPLWSPSSVTWQVKTHWLSFGEEKPRSTSNQACCHTLFCFFVFYSVHTNRFGDWAVNRWHTYNKKHKKSCGVERHPYNGIQKHLMRTEVGRQKIPQPSASAYSGFHRSSSTVDSASTVALERGSLEQNRCRPTHNKRNRCPNRRSKKF